MKTTLIFLLIVCFFITEKAPGHTPFMTENTVWRMDFTASQKINLARKEIYAEGCFFTNKNNTHAIDDNIKILITGFGYGGGYNENKLLGHICFCNVIFEDTIIGFNRFHVVGLDFNWFGMMKRVFNWYEIGIGKSALILGTNENDYLEIKTLLRAGLKSIEFGADFRKVVSANDDYSTMLMAGFDLSLQTRTKYFVLEPFVKIDYQIAQNLITSTGIDLLFSTDIYKISSPAFGLKYEYTGVSYGEFSKTLQKENSNQKLTLFYRYNISF